MSQCVGIDGAGYVVQVAETFPNCTEFAVLSPAQFDRLTFWADLSEQLDPAGPAFWPILGALLLAYATIAAIRMVLKNLWLANQRI